MYSYFNIYHLVYFYDAVTYGSISEAANANYVTQSAVSQAISKLESHFNTKLVFHTRQKLHITKEGKIVYKQANKIFKSIQEAYNIVKEAKEKEKKHLRLITTKSLANSLLPATYKKIREEMPHMELKFKTGGLNMIQSYLKREEAEIAIVVFDDRFKGFEKIPVSKGRLNLYQRKEAPKDLIEKGIFVDEIDGPYVKDLEPHLNDFSNFILQETSSWELTARFTDLGLGVGFFPDYLLRHDRYPELIPHPLKIPEFEYEICVIHNKGKTLSKEVHNFIENIVI